jgi:hypothetical protein
LGGSPGGILWGDPLGGSPRGVPGGDRSVDRTRFPNLWGAACCTWGVPSGIPVGMPLGTTGQSRYFKRHEAKWSTKLPLVSSELRKKINPDMLSPEKKALFSGICTWMQHRSKPFAVGCIACAAAKDHSTKYGRFEIENVQWCNLVRHQKQDSHKMAVFKLLGVDVGASIVNTDAKILLQGSPSFA